jgi:hypothetical protein
MISREKAAAMLQRVAASLPQPVSAVSTSTLSSQPPVEAHAPKPKSFKSPQIVTKDSTDTEEYVPVGIDSIVAASGKLLAINQGLTEQDDRDHYAFKRVMTPAKFLTERIRLDSDRVRRMAVSLIARKRSLDALTPGAFDGYVNGLISGNPLALPLEEINPLHLLEQARRLTHMGPGGIGSADAITPSMQAVNASQFGFVSATEGPECFSDDTEVFTKEGWKFWSALTDSDELAGLSNGRLVFHKPKRLIKKKFTGELVRFSGRSIELKVTGSHRVWVCAHDRRHAGFSFKLAKDVLGCTVRMDTGHMAYAPIAPVQEFDLPSVPKLANNTRIFPALPMTDWCELFGWYQAEGSFRISGSGKTRNFTVAISQCSEANPRKVERIAELLRRLGIKFSYHGRAFVIGGKQLTTYFSQFGFCDGKYIPEWVYEVSAEARYAMLCGLLLGDGRCSAKHTTFCSTSKALADGFERLAISLGYTTRRSIEKDSRPTTKTINYAVCILRLRERVFSAKTRGGVGGSISCVPYSGFVYCAETVSGFLLTRVGETNCGVWSGNSQNAGIDVRAATGSRLGSDGKIYQRFKTRAGKLVWLSPEDTQDLVVKLPD